MSIPRTPDELLDRAARAESTGQPRLAALYLNRAEKIAEHERREALGPIGRIYEDWQNLVQRVWTNAADALDPMRGGPRT